MSLRPRQEPAPGRGPSPGWLLPWLVGLALLVVPFLLPIPPALERDRVIRVLGNQLHVPLMCAITWLLYRRGPLRGRLARAVAAALVLGAAIELAQQLTGRHARLKDFSLDVIGIGLASSWLCWQRTRARRFLWGAILLLLTVPAQLTHLPAVKRAQWLAAHRFPLLADFETSRERGGWDDWQGGRLRFLRLADSHGGVLELSGKPPRPYPGAILRGVPHDWRGFTRLEWEVRAVGQPGPDSVAFTVRLDDFQRRGRDNWVHLGFRVGARWQTFSVELAELAARARPRPVDLAQVGSLLFYFYHPAGPVSIQVDNLRLSGPQ